MTIRTDPEGSLHQLLLELYSGRTPTPAAITDFQGREIVATPFGGHYGQAGWVLCVNGSPPRGCIVAIETTEHRTYPPAIFYLEMDKSRRLGTAQADIVRNYIAKLASADRNPAVQEPAGREPESGLDTQASPQGASVADASVMLIGRKRYEQLTAALQQRDELAAKVPTIIHGDGKPLPEGWWLYWDSVNARFCKLSGPSHIAHKGKRYLCVDPLFD